MNQMLGSQYHLLPSLKGPGLLPYKASGMGRPSCKKELCVGEAAPKRKRRGEGEGATKHPLESVRRRQPILPAAKTQSRWTRPTYSLDGLQAQGRASLESREECMPAACGWPLPEEEEKAVGQPQQPRRETHVPPHRPLGRRERAGRPCRCAPRAVSSLRETNVRNREEVAPQKGPWAGVGHAA